MASGSTAFLSLEGSCPSPPVVPPPPPTGSTDGPATLPLVEPDPTPPDTTGYTTYTVGKTGGTYDFATIQGAINAAEALGSGSGVIIRINNADVYNENVILNGHSQTGYIILRPMNLGGLPVYGSNLANRVAPSNVASMPSLRCSISDHCLDFQGGCNRYRIELLHLRAQTAPPDAALFFLVELRDAADGSSYPQNIVFDRCYLEGNGTNPYGTQTGGIPKVRKGINMDGANISVVNCYIEGINDIGSDSSAVGTVRGPGPLLIQNNFLEADGENILFGGGGAYTDGQVIHDVTIRKNHIFKRLSWLTEKDAGVNSAAVKNLVEIKMMQRVLYEQNVLENHWNDAQPGPSIVWKASTQQNEYQKDFTYCEDVVFRYNWIINVSCGFSIVALGAGADGHVETRRYSIHDNVISRLGNDMLDEAGNPYVPGGKKLCFQFLTNEYPSTHPTRAGQTVMPQALSIKNNTFIGSGLGSIIEIPVSAGQGAIEWPSTGFDFSNNLFVVGSPSFPFYFQAVGATNLITGLNNCFGSYTFAGNVFQGITFNASIHPTGNFWSSTVPTRASVGFTNESGLDYSLSGSSPLKNVGTDGNDPGANWSLVGSIYNAVRSTAVPT